MRDFAAWLTDAVICVAGAGLLYWALWGGGFPWFYAVLSGVALATYFQRGRPPTPGRRLVNHFANLS
jgi:hypothetical protein